MLDTKSKLATCILLHFHVYVFVILYIFVLLPLETRLYYIAALKDFHQQQRTPFGEHSTT